MYRRLLLKGVPLFIVLLICGMVFSCNDNDEVADAIEKIEVDLQVNRFDREFAEAEPLDIPILKKAYPYLFPAQYTDSVWVAKLQDSIQIELLSEVERTLSDFSGEQEDLETL
ncbi:MAG: gliding motility lipoprotein GldB, partial [Pricia sp.]